MAGARVLVVEDDESIRAVVRRLVQIAGAEIIEAGSGEDGLRALYAGRPDIVVLDIDLRGESAVPAITELRRRLPDTTVVVLTASTSDRLLVETVEAGARGFLTKDMDGELLRKSIIGAAHGELAMTRRRARLVTDHLAARRTRSPLELGLTDREIEIIRLVADGLTDREIAEALVLSRRTVEGHVARLIHKFGARNRTEAAARYRSMA